MGNIALEPNEQELGKWTINYIPPNGGKYLGKLIVTSQRLLFEAQFDASVQALVTGATYAEGTLIIPKELIQKTEAKSSFFKKKVIVTLKEENQQHVFDYGMLGIKKLVEAIG
ncbi:hypothetical protein BKI52_09505 [marine bacterium AO1-C]|nr:hypothetical protein BKI52_09505 [marine bacterium AO1-C]